MTKLEIELYTPLRFIPIPCCFGVGEEESVFMVIIWNRRIYMQNHIYARAAAARLDGRTSGEDFALVRRFNILCHVFYWAYRAVRWFRLWLWFGGVKHIKVTFIETDD